MCIERAKCCMNTTVKLVISPSLTEKMPLTQDLLEDAGSVEELLSKLSLLPLYISMGMATPEQEDNQRREMVNPHKYKLSDIRPYVNSVTNQQAKNRLNKEAGKIQDIQIFPGEETVWAGTIKFYHYPVAVLFEFDDIGKILKYMAGLAQLLPAGG